MTTSQYQAPEPVQRRASRLSDRNRVTVGYEGIDEAG